MVTSQTEDLDMSMVDLREVIEEAAALVHKLEAARFHMSSESQGRADMFVLAAKRSWKTVGDLAGWDSQEQP